jgi:hypothetical protein
MTETPGWNPAKVKKLLLPVRLRGSPCGTWKSGAVEPLGPHQIFEQVIFGAFFCDEEGEAVPQRFLNRLRKKGLIPQQINRKASLRA